MAYKVFTNGSVLNASEINENLMRQSVMVFSNAAARSAAITVPLEGMLTWLENVNRYESYNGTSWTPALSLTLVKSQVVGSGVTSVVVTDAFSADFDDYFITIGGGQSSTTSNIQLQLGSTNTNYYSAGIRVSYNSSTVTGENDTAGGVFGRVARATTNGINGSFTLLQPFNPRRTSIYYGAPSQAIGDFVTFGQGFQDSNTSFTGFTLIANVGTITGSLINVYGYRKSF